MKPADKKLIRALKGEPMERPPFWLMRQAGRYLPEYRAIRAQLGSFLDLCRDPALAAEVTLQPIRRFGMDAAILFSDILVIPWALGQDLAFQEGEGPKLSPIRDRAGLARLSEEPDLRILAPVYETIGRVKQALPAETALIGFAGAPWTLATYVVEGGSSRDFVHAKGFAARDPEGFSALIDLLAVSVQHHLDAQIAAGAEAVQIFDSWAGALEGEAFERWSIEPTRRIVAGLKARWPDVPVIGFPRGIGERGRAYVERTGVDAISIDQSLPLSFAREQLQPLAAVQGNLAPEILVAGGAALRDAVEHIVGALGDGPFVFNLGHGVVPQTPPEHVAALAALLRGS